MKKLSAKEIVLAEQEYKLARVEADVKGMEGTVVGLQHHVAAVCHERDAALAERDEVSRKFQAKWDECLYVLSLRSEMEKERDAALACAEEAEVENMGLRRMLMTRVEADRLSEANMLLHDALAQVQRLREAEASGRNVIIKALAAIVRLGLPDHVKVRGHGDRELIDREMVVQEVSRIRDAVDSLATPEPALTKQQATEAAALRTLTHEAPPDAPGVDLDFATEPKP